MNTCQTLLSLGWKEYPDQFRDYARLFCKNFDTPTKCSCNDKMQVCIYVSELQGREYVEIELCAELRDGTWIKIRNYVLPKKINKVLELIPRMLKIWECAAN